MSDYGGQKDGEEKEEDDDDLLKTLESEQQASLPNDEEWDLSDSEFFNFFIQPGFDSSSSPPLDNQPLINYREPRDHNLPLQGFPKGNDDTAQDDPISKKRRRYPFPFCSILYDPIKLPTRYITGYLISYQSTGLYFQSR